MIRRPIAEDLIEEDNAARLAALADEYASLDRALDRRGCSIEAIKDKVKAFGLAVPTWGLGVGGTRFAKFPLPGEPVTIHEKLEDAAVVQQLGRSTPRISPHFPWDRVEDAEGLRQEAESLGLAFDAVNSNTFQDQPGQRRSYKFGSLTHTDQAVRDQAIAHNLDCIALGRRLGSKAITVWIGDGANFPGQQNQTVAFDRYLDSMSRIYAALPADWSLLMEHKLYEPAFYSTVISDWGTNFIAAQQLGDKARCLVDLGHHAPSVNIEQIVARLARFEKLGGFHFNDSKYGDDDLDAGSINPHQLFLIFNELVDAADRQAQSSDPAYLIDQSHNVTDPIESLLVSAANLAGGYARALIVDRQALAARQNANDVLMAFCELRRAYEIDVTPILALARYELGGAIDPVKVFRASTWRERKAQEREPATTAAGIV
ncbi:MAG: TIM barrel protein [Caulobacteraceae bacterium]